jgi:hypothetical protein
MSAGAFVDARYVASYGDGNSIHPIRVQPETLTAEADSVENGSSPLALTSPISAIVTGSTRQLGLHARVVYAKLTGTPPATYATASRIRIPALSEAFYNACAPKGTVINYLGTTWASTGVRAEVVR